MSKLHLLLLDKGDTDVSKVEKTIEQAGLSAVTEIVTEKKDFIAAISHKMYDAVIACHPKSGFTARNALKALNDRNLHIPFIILADKLSQDYLTNMVIEGASDYILKDNVSRLPIAIMNAIEKFSLKADQERFFNELISRKTLMKDAERLAHFGSWREDMETGSTYWSDETFRILGYEPGQVVPSWSNFLARIHPDDAELVKQTTEEALKSRNRQKYTFRIPTKGGKVRYIHSEIFITRDAALRVLQLNGFVRDISEHTQAEIKLVESEQQYRTLFENNPSPLWVIDAATRKILDVNYAATELYGYNRDEFLKMTTSDLHPHNAAIPGINYDDISFTAPEKTSIWENTRKDGSQIKVEVSATDIVYDGVPCMLVLCNDVTDKLEVIDRLTESESRLITSQRIAHIGSWEVDLSEDEKKRNHTRWTDETYRIFGVVPEEIDMRRGFFRKLVHPDDYNIIDNALNEAIRTNGAYQAEFRIIRKDGTERVVSELGEIVFDKQTGKQKKITGTVRDITHERKAAEMLQKSEANLRSIFENTQTVYVLLDLSLKIVSYNQQASRFCSRYFNKNIGEGDSPVTFFTGIMQQLVRKNLLEALKGKNLNHEVSFSDPEGAQKWYNAHFHPVWGEDKMLGVIMSLRDITGRKTSELKEKKITEDLIQRNKELEQFAYIISHNLRAPVANIIGVADALTDNETEPEDREYFMEGLKSAVKKLDTIITDLNRILQMKHEVNENKELVRFSQLVNDIKFSLGNTTEKEIFQLKWNFDEADEMVTLKSYMHSIFFNLISNSIKYKQPDLIPVIEIISRKTPKKIELIFRDNGLGIDLEKNGSQLFGLYKRFHQHTAEGKGMGLYMVKTQVETLNGKINVKSKVNEGTEFRIEFEI